MSVAPGKVAHLLSLYSSRVPNHTSNYKVGSPITEHLTPKRPKSQNGFLGSLGRLSQCQKHERSSEILEKGGPM
jgi:hypothetical protein